MDYKTKLQTNNTALEGNNLDLQTILNTINSLPEAGSGESVNLDSEITAQDAVIAQIQSALEGKASTPDVETCTVEISFNDNYYDHIFATVFENGVISRCCVSNDYINVTLNNVVKGTSVIIVSDADLVNEDSITGCEIQELVREEVNSFIYKVCFEAYIIGDAYIHLSSSTDSQPV